MRKTKLLTQKRRLLTRYRKTGTRNRGFQQNYRKTNLAKLRKTKLLTKKKRLLTRYAKTGTRNRGCQQKHRKTNLAKLRKTKLLTQKIRLLTRYARTGTRNRGSQTNDTEEKTPNPLRKDGDTEPMISTKSSQNQTGKVEKNKTTDEEAKASKQSRKPKNVTRKIEASYATFSKLEERKPKTPFEAKRMYNISEGKHSFINYPFKK